MKSDLQLFIDGLICRRDQKSMGKYVLKSKFKRIRKNGMTIYKQDRKSEKVVIFLSGGAVLKFTHCLQKLVDLLSLKNCDVLVFENRETLNLTCVPNISEYIQSKNYTEVTIVGCSMGGVIGSHILSRLNNIEKKLICIDTPFRLCLTIIQAFEEGFCIWRPDIYSLYRHTIEIVEEEYNLFQITNFEQYRQFVFQHFGVDNYEFLSSMNPDIKNGKIISLFNEEDPIVIRHYSIPTVETYKQLLDNSSKFKEVRIKNHGPGHCTEWAYQDTSRRFIDQLRKFI